LFGSASRYPAQLTHGWKTDYSGQMTIFCQRGTIMNSAVVGFLS